MARAGDITDLHEENGVRGGVWWTRRLTVGGSEGEESCPFVRSSASASARAFTVRVAGAVAAALGNTPSIYCATVKADS